MLNEEDVRSLFAPYSHLLWESVTKAFQTYFKVNASELADTHERTKANYINDQIVKNLRQLLPDVEYTEKKGQRRLYLGVTACIRVKKVNRNLHPNNLATQASFDYYTNFLAPRFPNMPAPTALFLGYTSNRTKTAPEQVLIICVNDVLNRMGIGRLERIKPKIMWAIPIPKSGSISGIVGVPSLPPRLPVDKPVTKRVRSKKVKSPTKMKKDQ